MLGLQMSSPVQIFLARKIVGIAELSLQREGTGRWPLVRLHTTQRQCHRTIPRRVSGGIHHLITLAVDRGSNRKG